MKPEEALKILTSPLDEHPGSLEEVTKTIIQALEKQIAKKPIMGEFGVYVCSDCECVVEEENDYGHWEYRFCPGCGQAQDWSVEE